jgi:hypothetical protein
VIGCKLYPCLVIGLLLLLPPFFACVVLFVARVASMEQSVRKFIEQEVAVKIWLESVLDVALPNNFWPTLAVCVALINQPNVVPFT